RRGQCSWTVCPYANFGRPWSSSAGSVPYVAYCRTTPRKLYGFDGHPGMLTTVLPFRTSCTPDAPVGLGSAEATPPHDAHDPIAMIAPACAATSFTISRAVRPPIMQ